MCPLEGEHRLAGTGAELGTAQLLLWEGEPQALQLALELHYIVAGHLVG
jgi:hypothetical protein